MIPGPVCVTETIDMVNSWSMKESIWFQTTLLCPAEQDKTTTQHNQLPRETQPNTPRPSSSNDLYTEKATRRYFGGASKVLARETTVMATVFADFHLQRCLPTFRRKWIAGTPENLWLTPVHIIRWNPASRLPSVSRITANS